MISRDWTYYAVQWLVIGSAIPATLFPICYAMWSPGWWRSPIGRSLMVFTSVLALVFIHTAVAYVLGGYTGRRYVLMCLFGAFFLALWEQVYVLLRTQRLARRDP